MKLFPFTLLLLAGCATTNDHSEARKALCDNATPQIKREMAQGIYWHCHWPSANRDLVKRLNRKGRDRG